MKDALWQLGQILTGFGLMVLVLLIAAGLSAAIIGVVVALTRFRR